MAKGVLKLYKTYNFVDKDPIIDELRTVVQVQRVSYRGLCEVSGVSASTPRNWFGGKTKRPQYQTVRAIARALGYDLTLGPSNQREVTGYNKQLRDWQAAHPRSKTPKFDRKAASKK